MAEERSGAERAIRWMTTFSVVVLAAIAAILSYKHMYLLVRRYGEASWTAGLLPFSPYSYHPRSVCPRVSHQFGREGLGSLRAGDRKS